MRSRSNAEQSTETTMFLDAARIAGGNGLTRPLLTYVSNVGSQYWYTKKSRLMARREIVCLHNYDSVAAQHDLPRKCRTVHAYPGRRDGAAGASSCDAIGGQNACTTPLPQRCPISSTAVRISLSARDSASIIKTEDLC